MGLKIIRNLVIIILIVSLFTITAFASGPGTINADDVNMRSGPSTNSEVVMTLYNGITVNIHGIHTDWYEIDYLGYTGYVYWQYITPGEEQVIYTLTAEPVVEVEPTIEVPISAGPPITTGQTIVDSAMAYLGSAYTWGGESLDEGGFDCSGLVYTAYAENGIKINRIAQEMKNDGVEVSLDELEVGDILLFGSSIYNIWHVGLYTGDGNCIHSAYGIGVITQPIAEIQNMTLISARRIM